MRKRERHGKRHTREYEIWKSMIQRCHNPNSAGYRNYGGRGIVVCERWRTSFCAFISDMGTMPTDGMSIERRRNNDGYSPSNCVWATCEEQAANKRNNRYITYNGETHHLMEWERITGIPYRVLGRRLDRGWSAQRTITTPVKELQQRAVSINGKEYSLFGAAKFLGIPQSTMHKWFVQEGLSIPEILERRSRNAA
jgi:hypothetical protein